MSEKRFTSKVVDWWHNIDEVRVVFDGGEWVSADGCAKLLNIFHEENEQLKQQLLYDGDSICDICKHEYLTPSGDYFISNCRKGYEECSKEDLRYCTDFEVKELKE